MAEEQVEIDLDAPDPKEKPAVPADAGKSARLAGVEPEPVVEVVKTEPAPKEPVREASIEPEEGLKRVQKQLEDERAARIAAERRADEAARNEHAAKVDVQDTQKSLLENAIATVKSSQEALKARYREARSANDLDAEFQIQEEISSNAARLLQLEQGKKALEAQPKPQIRAPEDPVEGFARDLSPRSGAWVRAHPEYVRDRGKNAQMIAAHQLALARGHVVDSDEYFQSIERTLEISDETAGNGTVRTEKPTESALSEAARPKKAAPAAAPVSRTGTASGERSNIVKLSPEEVEMARLMGMTDREYALQKVELQKEGRLN
jgi:hypothetical protein